MYFKLPYKLALMRGLESHFLPDGFRGISHTEIFSICFPQTLLTHKSSFVSKVGVKRRKNRNINIDTLWPLNLPCNPVQYFCTLQYRM